MKKRFPVVYFVSVLLRIVGILWVLTMGAILVVGWITTNSGADKDFQLGILIVLGGVLAYVVGEVLAVLLAVEENTRSLVTRLDPRNNRQIPESCPACEKPVRTPEYGAPGEIFCEHCGAEL